MLHDQVSHQPRRRNPTTQAIQTKKPCSWSLVKDLGKLLVESKRHIPIDFNFLTAI